jgi:hypothetical protein
MRMRQLPGLVFGLGVLFLLPGCGPPTATVTGEVTVDGKPIDDGFITFAPADGNGDPVTKAIRLGKYEATMIAGKKFVQISAPIVTGKRPEYDGPNAPLVEIREESIHERFNSSSDLTFDAVAGTNKKNWTVEAKPRNP